MNALGIAEEVPKKFNSKFGGCGQFLPDEFAPRNWNVMFILGWDSLLKSVKSAEMFALPSCIFTKLLAWIWNRKHSSHVFENL